LRISIYPCERLRFFFVVYGLAKDKLTELAFRTPMPYRIWSLGANVNAVLQTTWRNAVQQHKLTIEYGENLLFSMGLSRDDFAKEARLILAAKLYELGKLTSGQAAKLCGKGRVDFLLSLPRVGIPMSNLRVEDAEAEIEFMRHD
jgi:predicted HTH domain antitoxin